MRAITLVLRSPGLPGGLQTFYFDPNPDAIRDERQALTTVLALPAGAVYRESHGRGIGRITLEGTTGQKARQWRGRLTAAVEIFRALRHDLYDQYLRLRTHPQQGPRTTLEYHNWSEDEHYLVEPKAFETPRNTETRNHFRYILTLDAYAPIKNPDRKLASPVKPDARVLANRFLLQAKRAQEWLTGAGQTLRKTAQKGASYLTRFVIQPLGAFVTGIENFVSGATAFVLLPLRDATRINQNIATTLELFADLFTHGLAGASAFLAQTLQVLRNLRRSFNRIAKAPELFTQNLKQRGQAILDELTEQEEDDDSEAVKEDIRGGRNQVRLLYAQLFESASFSGAKHIKIKRGDTLQGIAARELGDVRLWKLIAELNRLDSNDDLVVGASLLVPTQPATPGEPIAGALGDSKLADAQERIYGRDLALVSDGKGKLTVRLEPTGISGWDLARYGGLRNLEQAITLKTRIPQGALLEEPAYGMPPVLGKSHQVIDDAALAHALEVTAFTDPRIADAKAELETEGNRTDVRFKLYPLDATTAQPISAVVKGV